MYLYFTLSSLSLNEFDIEKIVFDDPSSAVPASNHCKELVRLIPLKPHHIATFLNGHNGIRNRVAKSKTYDLAANMNILHWDYDLQRMAEGWIKQCKIQTDNCDFICMK